MEERGDGAWGQLVGDEGNTQSESTEVIMSNLLRHVAPLLILVTLSLFSQPISGQLATNSQGADTLIWQSDVSARIGFRVGSFFVLPDGNIALLRDPRRSRSGLAVVDQSTGDTLWTRPDERFQTGGFNPIQRTRLAVLRSRDGISVLNLANGETVWTGDSLPLKKVRGFIDVPEFGMLLVYGEGLGDHEVRDRTVLAVDLHSGVVLWVRPDLLTQKPPLESVDRIHTLAAHQRPLVDSDSTFILYISKDGPIKVNARTGETIWKVGQLVGKSPPRLSLGYANLVLEDSILFVPYDRRLAALDPSSGRVLWRSQDNLRGLVAQMELTPWGLVVRTAKSYTGNSSRWNDAIDLIRVETGDREWDKAISRGGGWDGPSVAGKFGPFVVLGDTVFVGDQLTLFAIRLEDQFVEARAQYVFRDKERPESFEQHGDRFVLLSAHNVITVDSGGTHATDFYYPAPGRSLLGSIVRAVGTGLSWMGGALAGQGGPLVLPGGSGQSALDPAIRARLEELAGREESYHYVYTKAPDASGREGFSLTRIRREDGEEAGRLWFDKRSPAFQIDYVTGHVYRLLDGKELLAFRFPERQH